MSFAEKIKGVTAADLMAAFPKIPRSTAYDWLKGPKAPPPYLQPMALSHIEKHLKGKGKAAAPIKGSTAVERDLTSDPMSGSGF